MRRIAPPLRPPVAGPAPFTVAGAGLGLRRGLMGPLLQAPPGAFDFLEVAPENWISVGGRLGRQLRSYTERHPCVAHGLSLSIGSRDPLDLSFLRELKGFFSTHGIRVYSEHLSFCSDGGHLYDLMPIPFTEAAVRHVVQRVTQVQDILGRRLALENVSYYTPLGADMAELDFLTAILEQADCSLLLDVNNLYVNSINHRYDPLAFLKALPADRIAYCHIAGHHHEAPDLIVDTHGSAVSPPVWALLTAAYQRFGPLPTLLERDFNFPPLPVLLGEIAQIKEAQRAVHGAEAIGDAA